MSPGPNSTSSNPEQRIADLERQLAEREAELDKAQRKLNEATTERDEALAQQTASAEVLQVINSSPGNVAPVFEAMLERAICFCQADEGILTNRNGDELEVVAVRSSRPEMSGSVGKRFAIDRETVGGRVMLEGRTVHIRDVNADPDYRNPRMAKEQIGTLLGVPLLREGVVVGSFSLARERIEAFTEKQIAVVESFAAQAVIAMENARLRQRRARRWSSRLRRRRFCKLSTHRPATSRRCSTRCWKRRRGFAGPLSALY